mmetsp:Transcript_14439/g.12320  ORF Transcript_14439/g.12320 Transcript_14439/m.12320 type:complete len:207 (+) Transcript_14439:25-645(+)
MCRMMLQKGTCPNIKRCPYAHDIKQVRSTNAFFKTKLCSFHQEGFCKLGNKCRYAHSESELNPDDWPVGNDVNIVENPNIRERSSSKASSASTAPSEPDYDCSQLRNTPTTRRSFGPLFEDESTVERSLEDPVIDQTSMMMSTYPGHFYHYYMYAPHPPMVDLYAHYYQSVPLPAVLYNAASYGTYGMALSPQAYGPGDSSTPTYG